MKRTITGIIFIAAILATANAVTVVNGSFENTDSSYVDAPGADHMNTATAPGWYIANNSPDWFWGEGPSGLWETPYGDHFAHAAANGFSGGAYREAIGQIVTGFTVGQSYTLDFSHTNGLYYNPGTALYEGVGTVGGWQVLIDGLSVLVTNSTNDNSIAALNHTTSWQNSSVTFTATDTSHDFWFAAWRPGDGSQSQVVTFQFLDDVTVNPVPEPGSASLVLLSTALLHRRKRSSRPIRP